jgi:DNA polymerase-3 subunit epsilon
VALLKESEEIKKTNLNTIEHSAKVFSMGTISEMDEKGYLNLKLLKADGRKKKLLHSPA